LLALGLALGINVRG